MWWELSLQGALCRSRCKGYARHDRCGLVTFIFLQPRQPKKQGSSYRWVCWWNLWRISVVLPQRAAGKIWLPMVIGCRSTPCSFARWCGFGAWFIRLSGFSIWGVEVKSTSPLRRGRWGRKPPHNRISQYQMVHADASWPHGSHQHVLRAWGPRPFCRPSYHWVCL